MPDERTELEKRNFLRLSNEEANKLTKECIQTALIHLMAEEDIDAISISRIVKKAGVSRTAFYNNYSSKEDVLSSITTSMMHMINGLIQDALLEAHRMNAYLSVFQTIRNNPLQFEMLLASGIHGREYTNYSDYVSARYPHLDVKIRLLLFGLAGMVKNILLDWYTRDMREDVHEMAELCSQLTEDFMQRILDIDPEFKNTLADLVLKGSFQEG